MIVDEDAHRHALENIAQAKHHEQRKAGHGDEAG